MMFEGALRGLCRTVGGVGGLYRTMWTPWGLGGGRCTGLQGLLGFFEGSIGS